MKSAVHMFLALCLVALFLSRAALADVIPSPSNDIALQSNGGVAYSSLGNGSYDGNHPPSLLNDGNRDGNYGSSPYSLYHSATNSFPAGGGYVGVVLNGMYDITSINLFDRTDCCGTRIDNSGNTPFTAECCSTERPSGATTMSSRPPERTSASRGAAATPRMAES